MLGQELVLGHQPAVLRLDVGARVVDAVVHRVAPAAGRLRQVPVRPLANPLVDQNPRALGADALVARPFAGVAALPQLNRHMPRLQQRAVGGPGLARVLQRFDGHFALLLFSLWEWLGGGWGGVGKNQWVGAKAADESGMPASPDSDTTARVSRTAPKG